MMNNIENQVRAFLPWAKRVLKIHNPLRITLTSRPISQGSQGSFGSMDLNNNRIVIYVKDRHPLDVLRTLSHELVHVAQNQSRSLNSSDGKTGSAIENEANAVAGILLRLWSTRKVMTSKKI
jgi:Zn-dependent peptidase ImmA (M78 family)